jgi:hypothetical protein
MPSPGFENTRMTKEITSVAPDPQTTLAGSKPNSSAIAVRSTRAVHSG